jgi:hypothetical protein
MEQNVQVKLLKTRQEKKSKKQLINEIRRNMEALVFHLCLGLILIGGLNSGLIAFGYDVLPDLSLGGIRMNKVLAGSIFLSCLFVGYWYVYNRIVLKNAK